MTPEERCELLAIADSETLIGIADECLRSDPTVQVGDAPTVGTVVLQVREPVAHERFYLAEAVVTTATVSNGHAAGWAMRVGDDPPGALAAAICDVEVAANGPLAARVAALCEETRQARHAERAEEWALIAPTEVRFEEYEA